MSSLPHSLWRSNFEQYKDWIDHYSGGIGVKITFHSDGNYLMAMSDDFKNPELFVNLHNIQEKLCFTEEETLFALFHELEHMFENIVLRSTWAGEQLYKIRMSRLNPKDQQIKWAEKALHALENILRDIHVNNNVISDRNIPVLRSRRTTLYRNKLFQEHNFVHPIYPSDTLKEGNGPLPKHVQFLYACIRELMVPDELCIIDPEVRIFLQRIRLSGALRRTTESWLVNRLPAIWKEIEPQYLRWYIEDTEKLESNSWEWFESDHQEPKNQKNEAWEGALQWSRKKNHDDQEWINTQEECENTWQKGGNGKGQNQSVKKRQKVWSDVQEKTKDFSQYYQKWWFPHVTDQNEKQEESNGIEQPKNNNKAKKLITDPKKIEENLRKIFEKKQSQQQKGPLYHALERRAREMPECTDDTLGSLIDELMEYDSFVDKITQDENLIAQIIEVFQQIRSRRMKPVIKSRGPVREDWSDGNFHLAAIASGVSAILSWDADPEMYTTRQVRHIAKKYVGTFRLRFISDGSGSMEGFANQEQKKAVLIMFEALSRISNLASQYKNDLIVPLECSFDGRIFSGWSEIEKFKHLSPQLTDSDRIRAYRALNKASGGTPDYIAAKEIYSELQWEPEQLESIQSGNTKEIVMIMTDGWSGNHQELIKAIKSLRMCWAIVYGIDIWWNGDQCEEYYWKNDTSWFGRWIGCPHIADLPKVITSLLIHHLDET